MTRNEGRRAAGRRCAVSRWLALALLVAAGDAGGWTIGGRFGIEVDGLGEEFSSGAIFDERLDPIETDGSDIGEELVVSREAKVMGLLELQLEQGSTTDRWLRLGNTTRAGDDRYRNSFLAEGGLNRGANRFRFEGSWDRLGGGDEPAAGSTATLRGSWDRRRLPLGLSSQLLVAADWSRTDHSDLAAIFDYRTVRGHAELRGDLGSSFELRGAGGYRDKTATSSSVGSYGAGWGELELTGSSLAGHRGSLSLRIEDRSYASDTTGVPSSVELSCDGRYSRRLTDRLRPYLQQRFERETYDRPEGIFQDHDAWEAEIGADFFPRGAADADLAAMDAGSWRLRIGGAYEIFRTEEIGEDLIAFDSTFDSFGGLLGLAREGGSRLWFDFTLESGRREYRNSGESGSFVFEGLNLSLASSDYTYVSTTLIAQWSPSSAIRTEAFLEWDGEYHDRSQDDFHIWIINVAVTRPF